MIFDDWWDIGRELAGRDARGPRWAAGDWWVFGQHRYGERARAAAQGLFALQALMDAAAVAQTFEPLRRRVGLSFDHHVAVAHLPAAEADALLDAADNDGWSVSEMRAAILRLAVTPLQIVALGLPTAPPKSTDPRRFDGIETVQAEAIPPDILAEIIQRAIDDRLDDVARHLVLNAEVDARTQLLDRFAGL